MLLGFRGNAEARAALLSGDRVEVVEDGGVIRFLPRDETASARVIFFAGALVHPAAYAPLMHRLAARGHPAIAIALPGRTAPSRAHEERAFATARAEIRSQPEGLWVVGGHSKGGYVAAEFARAHPDGLDGLLLVGTSHPRDASIAHLQVPVIKVFGSRDGLASEAEVRQFASNLPPTTQFVGIEGGNHAQFGYYWFQLGDRRATIDREEQQAQLTAAVLGFLAQIETKGGN